MLRVLALVLVAIVPVLPACNGRSAGTVAAPEAEAPSSAATADAAPSAAVASASAAPTPPVHHRGIAGLFFRAALEADLTDDEKSALDKLEEPLRSDPGQPRHEINAFHADLVASMKAGRLDNAKIQADLAAINKASAGREENQAAALSGLHDALTPEQRKTVVDAIRAMQAAHDRPPASPSAASATDAATRRLERMRLQLGLDDDQQRQVFAVLTRGVAPSPAAIQARFEAGRKQIEAVLAAFEKDAPLDAKKLDLAPAKKLSEPMERQAKYIGQLLSILRPEQRDRLAGLMEHPRVDHGHGAGETIVEPLELGDGRGH
jgi:Spy/CpxP family protein refolding chaperone